jgi:hypothetical protein
MANSIVLETSCETPFNSFHAVWTKFNLGVSGETVVVPRGCTQAAVMETGTWTVSITAGADSDTVAVTGTPGVNLTLVTRHGGNPASVRS